MRAFGIILPVLLTLMFASSLTFGGQYVNITPYSNATQIGYQITNAATNQSGTVGIGFNDYTFIQGFINPSNTGLTVNNHTYTLYLYKPLVLGLGNNSYAELIQTNFTTPNAPSANFNLYKNITTTTSTTTVTTTSIQNTTTIATTSIMQHGTTPSGTGSNNIVIAVIAGIAIVVVAAAVIIYRHRSNKKFEAMIEKEVEESKGDKPLT